MAAVEIFALLQIKVLPPSDAGTNIHLLLRWLHIVSGIAWIGLLYYFNLVQTPFLAALEPPVRAKVVPALLPEALAWFRGTAIGTVAAGLPYWVLFLRREPADAPGLYLWATLAEWTLAVVLVWLIHWFLLRLRFVAERGWLYGLTVAALVAAFAWYFWTHTVYDGMTNRAVSIGLGGGIGLFLLLNVLGIVGPAQARLIAWHQENPGAPPPPELRARLQQAALVSRASFWLTLPLLLLMAAASHYPLFAAN